MGIVWLAWDQQLDRNVALKFLTDQIVHDTVLFADLKRETRRSLELTHPHIVRIYDFVQDRGRACISMEFVDGETLSALRVKKSINVFDTPDLEPWLADWCQAMHYAHTRARIVHCDLKPANLMVNSKGALKITDFGIARSLSESVSTLTMVRGKSGTLVYMSPQQLNGDPPSVMDDIYSMGATLYELLTSKPPFYRGQIDRQIFDKIPPSVVARREELGITSPFIVPLHWEETIAACLAKEPIDRPQGAAEIFMRLSLVSPLQVERKPQFRSGVANTIENRSDKRGLVRPAAQITHTGDPLMTKTPRLFGFARRHPRSLVAGICAFLLIGSIWRFVVTGPQQKTSPPVVSDIPRKYPSVTPKALLGPTESARSTSLPKAESPTPKTTNKASAPTKAELTGLYTEAFTAFNAGNYAEALRALDRIDARQPDLVESLNLRGVILMRGGNYEQAESNLRKAVAIDPKFWNARFNLAEIPFLQRKWPEARGRFEELLQDGGSELGGETTSLVHFKIFLTYLTEPNQRMSEIIYDQLASLPQSPATFYAKAAIALEKRNLKEANDWLSQAKKTFSPDLNKLYLQGLYEIGWLQKPPGETRAALEITTAAEKTARAKAVATEKSEVAEQAFQQRDYTAAKKLIDEADAADPNQPATINLRGEILLAQKDFDGAENAFKQAAKLDPKFREAQYNLAQIPFKKKEYTKARDRFEALFNNTPAPGGDKNQAAQIIKFKIFLTLLLEGKDSRAQKMMEQFQFKGDTPALYYAQAAWEFKHNNPSKANDWIVSAKKIYSPALNLVFADSFYDVGWLAPPQTPSQSPTPSRP
jgi:serine/threonine protein kinase/tetratricopeptide (TPR) repeat protein